jgi:hypothetical protein
MIGISSTLRVEVERAFSHYFSLAAKAQYLQYLQVIQCMEFGDKLYTSWQVVTHQEGSFILIVF